MAWKITPPMAREKYVPASLIRLAFTAIKATAKVIRDLGAFSRYFFIRLSKKPVLSMKAVAAIMISVSFSGVYPT